MKALKGKYRAAGKGCLLCASLAVFSGLWHGSAEAAENSGKRFCIVVPPDRNRTADDSVRHYPGAEPMYAAPVEGKVESFFKGQVKKVGVGLPDCFRIDAEESAARAASGIEPGTGAGSIRPETGSSVFPGAGYFNRFSMNGRQGVAFGAGLGHTGPGTDGDEGSPDARVGIVFGFNF